MKIILTAVGSTGDVYPFLAIARLLKARTSHDIVIIANERFRENAEYDGFEFYAHSSVRDYEMSFLPPEGNLKNPLTLIKGVKNLLDYNLFKPIETTFFLIKDLQVKDTLLIAHGASFGARLARDAFAIPLISAILSPTAIPGNTYSPFGVFLNQIGSSLCKKRINQFCSENNLALIRKVDGWSLSPDGIAALFPDFLDKRTGRWPKEVSAVGYQAYTPLGTQKIVQKIKAFINDDPVILFTPGTPIRFAHEFFLEALKICTSLNRKGIFITDYVNQVPKNLPDYIMHAEFAPFREIFPLCEIIVHHGGIGTMMECLLAGKTQLVVPQTADQPYNAARLKELNVADTIPFGRFSASKGRKKIASLLNNQSVLQSCKSMKEKVSIDDNGDKILNLIQSVLKRKGDSILSINA
jgi:rhamnosyltransferase subunit B